MSINVSNPSADRNEKIDNAAKVLGRSKHRKKIFSEIYRGKQKVKTVSYLSLKTGLNEVRVMQEGGKLAAEDIVKQTKVKGKTAYQKITFYGHNKGKIIDLSNNKTKLSRFPTRSNPQSAVGTIKVNFPKKMINIQQIHVDNIESFSKVKKIKSSSSKVTIYEKDFKKGLKNILGETGSFKDWGGETNDFFSTRIKINGKRLTVVFALKGRGTKGKLTIRKTGKNSDQIPRLFKSPADVFIFQYGEQIDESVLDLMKSLAIAKSVAEGRKIFYGIIDGRDTSRILQAYSSSFK